MSTANKVNVLFVNNLNQALRRYMTTRISLTLVAALELKIIESSKLRE